MHKEERGSFAFSFTTVIGLDINFAQYPACEAGGLIDYNHGRPTLLLVYDYQQSSMSKT